MTRDDIESNSSRNIRKGAVISYILIAVQMLAGLLYTPWMIKCIGQSDYGLYTLATSFISIFMVDFGLSSAVSRFVSKYLAEDDQNSVNNVLGIVAKIYLVIAVLIFCILLVLFFFIEYIYSGLTPNEVERFRVIYIVVGFYNVVSFPLITFNGILTSYELFFELKICMLFNKIATIVLMIIALFAGFGLYALVLVNAIVGLFTYAIKFYLVKRKTRARFNMGFRSRSLITELFSFSVWSTIITITQRLIFNIMPSILAAVSSSASVAVFGVASTLEGFVYSFSDGINGMFLPKTSRIIASENKNDGLNRLMIRVGRVNLFVVAIVVVGFICAGKEFILLWMGEDYINAYYCTIMLIVPDIVYAPQQIGRTTLIAENKIKYQAAIFSFVGILNVVISLLICADFGEIGAGISIGTVFVIRLILMSVVYWKILGFNMKRFFFECHIKMTPPILITLILGIAIFKLIPINGWILFVVKCFAIVVIYFVLMWLIGFNDYEKNLIKSMLKKAIPKKDG